MDSTTHETALSMTDTVQAFDGRASTFDATIDYITAFWNQDALERFPEAQIMEQINGEIAEGHREQRRSRNGIDWFGSGGAFVGTRDDQRFYRAHGHCAHAGTPTAAQTCSSLSRIDGALTVGFEHPQTGRARTAFDGFRQLAPAAGQPRSARLIENSTSGETCYVGSRQSDTYLRLYDWGVAHDAAPAGCRWRFEVEWKGARANSVGSLLLSHELRELAIAALVRTTFTDRRIEVPWETGILRSAMETRQPTTVERQMAWLASQVRPTVGSLTDSGYLSGVLDALGLTGRVTINPPNNGIDNGNR